MGPVELVVLRFPGDRFTGGIAGSLKELVDGNLIRIVDAVFARKRSTTDIEMLELGDLDAETAGLFDPLIADISGLVNRDDVETLTSQLPIGAAAAVLLIEELWAQKFADQIAAADGEVVLTERIPRAVMDELLRDRDTELAAVS